MIVFRMAKQSDYKSLADIHMECGRIQKGGFMHKLGRSFLRTYYKISLKEKKYLIVVAENESGTMIGFNSGTMDAAEHIINLNKNRLFLGIASLPAILKKPKILKEILIRNKFLRSSSDESTFVIKSGPRGEYWAWSPSFNDPANSVVMRQVWINIIYELGCRSFRYELDLSNTSFERYSRIFGCKLIEEITLPDGRKRAIVEQTITNKNKKRK